MGKRFSVKIDKFDGGMSDEVRNAPANMCALISDAKIYPSSIVQHRAWQAWSNNAEKITRFLYGKDTSGTFKIIGFGGDSGDKPKIFSSALAATAWSAMGSAAATGARARNVFFRYRSSTANVDANLYFWQNGTVLSRMLESTAGITESYQAITYTNVAQPVRHSLDDIAYFFSDNKVHKLNDTVFTSTVLTLPANLKIMGGAEYGIYLAIFCTAVKDGEADTVVYLWDRDSSVTTLTDKIDLGTAPGVYIVSDENKGLWIVQDGTRNGSLFGDDNALIIRHISSAGIRTEKIFREDLPSYFTTFSIETAANAETLAGDLYFMVKTITRKDAVTRYSFVKVRRDNLSYTLDRDADSSNVTLINGIFQLQGSWYFAHSSTTTFSQGNLSTNTAYYESLIFSSDETSKLLAVGVSTEPLPNGGSITLAYRKDAETAWTTIFTNTTLSDEYHEAINIESTGVTLPQYNEIQFQIQYTGLAVPTGFDFKSEEIKDRAIS